MTAKKIFRVFVILTGILSAAAFVAPILLFGIINAGNIAGLILSALWIGLGVFFERICNAAKRLWKKRIGRLVLCGAGVFAVAVCCFVVFVTAEIVGAVHNPPTNETTVVVLGCQVRQDGPSLMLVERLKAAEKFLVENPDAKCILSGGKGTDEPISESECMYQWLVEKGIASDRLFVEDKSTSTEENLLFSKALIEREGLIPEITIITSDFHQYRAKKIAQKLGLESYSVSGKSVSVLLPTYCVRELGGALVVLLLGN